MLVDVMILEGSRDCFRILPSTTEVVSRSQEELWYSRTFAPPASLPKLPSTQHS